MGTELQSSSPMGTELQSCDIFNTDLTAQVKVNDFISVITAGQVY